MEQRWLRVRKIQKDFLSFQKLDEEFLDNSICPKVVVEGPTFSNDLLKLTDTEWQVSLLAGYAGTDFIESLYKIKFHKIS